MKERISEIPNHTEQSVSSAEEPRTEEEAADLLQRTAWAALARLSRIISNPNASDMLVVSAAKEVASQLQKRNSDQENGVTYVMMPQVTIDNVPLVLQVGKS